MKNKIKKYVLAISMCIGLTACSDFFEPVPGIQEDLESTFSSRVTTEQYLNNIYSYVRDLTREGNPENSGGIFTASSLEAGIIWEKPQRQWNLGTANAGTDFVKYWFVDFYKGIAKVSTFLQNVDRCQEATPNQRAKWKLEARALRALFYFELFRIYGPIPIIGEDPIATDAPLSEMIKERNTVDQCVEYIASELQKVIDEGDGILDNQTTLSNMGRINIAACKALKAKLYLYWASPLFNGNTDYTSIQNEDGTQLFPQTVDNDKWRIAKEAYQQFIAYADQRSMKLAKVYRSDGTLDPYASYRAVTEFYTTDLAPAITELVFVKMTSFWDYRYWVAPKFSPTPTDGNISGGGGFYTTQETVDLFFTNNGLRIADDASYDNFDGVPSANNFASGIYYDPHNPDRQLFNGDVAKVLKQWKDREPRFYANITYSGSTWINEGQQGDGKLPTDFTNGGNCGMSKSSGDCPTTGYLVRKGALATGNNGSNHFSPLIRMADMYLGYAEALCMYNGNGDLDTALKYLNEIRNRAGIPEYSFTAESGKIVCPKTQADLLNRIRRERLVELVFEWNHYFDVRRWKVADGTNDPDSWVYPEYHKGGEGGQIYGMNMQKNYPEFFEKIVCETRVFDKKYYFLPIPDEDIRRIPTLVQNFGWKSE